MSRDYYLVRHPCGVRHPLMPSRPCVLEQGHEGNHERVAELYAPGDSPRYDSEPDWQLEQGAQVSDHT